MSSLAEFIIRCQTNDPLAWEDLCKIVERAARCRIKRLLQAYGFDTTRVEDVLQELYCKMRTRTCRLLRVFHGTSEEELRAFLGVVAYRFALKLIAKWDRIRETEQEALHHLAPPMRDGPSEQEIEIARRDLESMMPAVDRDKLRQIAQASGAPWDYSLASSAIPQRTLRRWRLELFREYGDRI